MTAKKKAPLSVKEREERIETEKRREYLVVKSNDVINNVSRHKYALTALEQKALAFIVSQIHPPQGGTDEKPEHVYSFPIKTFCEVCGIDYTSGKNYNDVKGALERLAENGFWLHEGRSQFYFTWIHSPRIDKGTGKITVRISEDVMPYLWNLQERFTQYQLYNILALKSTYSIALYEILKSNCYKGVYDVLIEDLKRILSIEDKYEKYQDLRRRVVEPAVKEINEFTNLTVAWEPVKGEGRSYTRLIFTIEEKRRGEERQTFKKVFQELNH